MTVALLQDVARRLIQHHLALPEPIARRHIAELGGQSVAFSDGVLTAATLTLTKAGAFGVAVAGLKTWLYLYDAGSATVIPGWYTGCRVSDNAVTLDRDPRTPAAIALECEPIDIVCIVGELATFTAISVAIASDRRDMVRYQLPALPDAVWPAEADVADGVTYGPNGDDYEGTLE